MWVLYMYASSIQNPASRSREMPMQVINVTIESHLIYCPQLMFKIYSCTSHHANVPHVYIYLQALNQRLHGIQFQK